MQSPPDAIIVKDLCKAYGKIEALKDVNLTVSSGEIFGLLGANGAGKTTLIRILIGSTMPTSGEVLVLGKNPRQSRSLCHQIGYMPQVPALYEDLSARANVRFFGQAHRVDRLERHIDEALTFVDLLERQHDLVHTFSGGMKQRLSLACALVHQPRILLLDEPTTGIDPQLREAFWQHFRKLTGEGVTLMISTHQMDEAVHCDRLVVMRAGVILACDTPEGILRRGQTRVSIWDDQKIATETMTDYPEQLVALLRQYDLTAIRKIEIVEDTMEDIVLRLIRAGTTAPGAGGDGQ